VGTVTRGGAQFKKKIKTDCVGGGGGGVKVAGA